MTNILIVDDEETVGNLIARILETKGYICVQAVDAAEARDCLKMNSILLRNTQESVTVS